MLQRSRAASRAAAAFPSLLSSALLLPREENGGEGEEDGGERGGGGGSASGRAAAAAASAGTVPPEVVEAIMRDVGRTFPSVAGFEPGDNASSSGPGRPPGRRARSLANVLIAYAAFDPSVSYCQGMNFLGGLLLLYLDSDGDGTGGSEKKQRRGKCKKKTMSEDGDEQGSDFDSDGGDGFDETLAGDDSAERAAFGLLTHLLMSKGLRSLYAEGMEALTARLSHLQLLLPPEIKQHFSDNDEVGGIGLPVTLFAAPWFMTAFASDFPVPVAARLVDAMLTTPPAVDRPLLRLAVACVRACTKQLLAAKDAEAAVKVFRRDLPSKKLSRLHDLVSEAFEREWRAEELEILSSERPRLTTEEPPPPPQGGAEEGSSSSSSSAALAPPSPFEEEQDIAASSPRGSSPSAAAGIPQQKQHRKLKWEDALLARRAASADREAEPGGGAAEEEAGGISGSGSGGGDLLQLPPPLPSFRAPPSPSPLSVSGAAAAAKEACTPRGATLAAEEALAELLSCRLELDPPSPSPAAATGPTTQRAPPLSSDSLWTSFRKAAEEPEKKQGEASSSASASAAAVAAARERAAADLEGWSSFQRSASLTEPPPEEGEK